VDGIFEFLATEAKPGETIPDENKIVAQSWDLAIKTGANANVTPGNVLIVPGEEKTPHRKWKKESDDMPPDRLAVGYEQKIYRKLGEGDIVEKGQMLVQIDAGHQIDDLRIRISRVHAKEANLRVTIITMEEAQMRWSRMRWANSRNPNSFASEEVLGAKLTYERYVEEEQSKKAGLIQAQGELTGSLTTLRKHEIRSPVRGVVKVIHKQEGEGVKAWETVVEILPVASK